MKIKIKKFNACITEEYKDLKFIQIMRESLPLTEPWAAYF